MAYSSQIISEMLHEIRTMGKFDSLKPIIHSQFNSVLLVLKLRGVFGEISEVMSFKMCGYTSKLFCHF